MHFQWAVPVNRTTMYDRGGKMKIVICDDSIADLSRIEKALHKYMNEKGTTDYQTEKYSDPTRLFRAISDKQFADIYILDMIMADKTGIDIGRHLRKSGCGNAIIYITTSDEFALDAYNVHAIRYLLKPIREADLFEALDYAFSCSEIKCGPVYLIKTKEGLVSAPYSKIEYIENVSRMLDVHLTDGETLKSIFIRKSFDEEIFELIQDGSFIQVHKSYIINLNYVKQLTSGSIIMESGAQIPVSKARAASVRKAYLVFISEQYR